MPDRFEKPNRESARNNPPLAQPISSTRACREMASPEIRPAILVIRLASQDDSPAPVEVCSSSYFERVL